MTSVRSQQGCPSERRLHAWWDGELDAHSSAAIARHLERCAPCAHRIERLAVLEEVSARALAPPPVDAATWRAHTDALREAIERTRERPPVVRLGRWLGALSAAAAAVLLAITAIVLQTARHEPAPVLAFESGAGANTAHVLELSVDPTDGYSAGVMFPRDDSEPVVIVLTRS